MSTGSGSSSVVAQIVPKKSAQGGKTDVGSADRCTEVFYVYLNETPSFGPGERPVSDLIWQDDLIKALYTVDLGDGRPKALAIRRGLKDTGAAAPIYELEIEYQVPAGVVVAVIDLSARSLPVDQYFLKDINDQALVNKAGDLFSPPPPRRSSHTMYSVKMTCKNFGEVFSDYPENLVDKINDASWCGLDAYSVAFRGFAYRRLPRLLNMPMWAMTGEHDGYFYWEVTCEFEYNPDYWSPVKVLNAGPRWKDSKGNLHLPCDDKQRPHSGIILLDDDGNELDTSHPDDIVATYCEFELFNQATFDETFLLIDRLGPDMSGSGSS